MIFDILKKVLCISLCVLISDIIPVVASNDSDPLVYVNSQNKIIPFTEYKLSPENNDSFFRGFNTTREEAINKVLNKITVENSKTTRKFVEDAIIFEYDDPGNSDQAIRQYLDHYKATNEPVKHTLTRDGRTFSFIHAIAYSLDMNLMIYNKQDDNILIAVNKFNIDGNTKTTHLLFDSENNNYNLLLPPNAAIDVKRNAEEEDRRAREFIFYTTLFSDNSTEEDSQSDSDVYETMHPVTEDAMDVDGPRFTFTEDDFARFLHNKIKRLPGIDHGRQNHLRVAYEYCEDKKTHTLDPNKKFTFLLGQAKLLLERNYLGEEQNEQREALRNVFDAMQTQHGIKDRLTHYGKTYRIKHLVKLTRYQEAYNLFKTLSQKFTQTSRVDIAGIIIENNFIPEEFSSAEEARKYAVDLITTTTVGRRRQSQSGNKSNTVNNLGAPDYLNSTVPQTKKGSLLRRARRQNRAVPIDSTAEAVDEQLDILDTFNIRRVDDEIDSTSGTSRVSGQARVSSPYRSSTKRKRSSSEDDERPRKKARILEEGSSSKNVKSARGDRVPRTRLHSPEDEGNSTDLWEEENDQETFFYSPDFNTQKDRARKYIYWGKSLKNDVASDKYKKALEIAREIHDQTLEAQALIGLGNAKYTNSDHPHNDYWYLEAREIAHQIHDQTLEAQALIGLGNARYTNSDHPHNDYWYLEAREIAREIHDQTLEAQALIGLGNARYQNTQSPWYRDALDIACQIHDQNLEVQALIGLGNARYTHSDHPHDYDWYRDALEIAHQIHDQTLEAQALIGLGNARYTDKAHSRSDWYLKVLDIAREIHDQSLEAQALIGLGNARYTNSDHSHNDYWYLKALEIAHEIHDQTLEVQALIGLGNYSCSQRDNSKGITYYKKALKLCKDRKQVKLLNEKIRNAEKYLNKNNNFRNTGYKFKSQK
jgi:hypothetical protein